MAFNPNVKSFRECLDRIEAALKKTGLTVPRDRILQSKDAAVKGALVALNVTNVPSGFSKVQLPVHLTGPSQFFLSFGAPNVQVPRHSHDEGDGLRVIMSGSLIYNGTELTAGDWMFIPKGVAYEFQVGPMGVGMFYCYQCCCA